MALQTPTAPPQENVQVSLKLQSVGPVHLHKRTPGLPPVPRNCCGITGRSRAMIMPVQIYGWYAVRKA